MNYSALAAKGKALVDRFGMTITLIRLSSAPPVDRPWEGARPTPGKEYRAVFVDPGSLGLKVEVNDFLKSSSQVAIIATADDLRDYHKLNDGERDWKITGFSSLRPAGTPLLWYVGVAE